MVKTIHTNKNKKLIKTIKKIRKEKGLTQIDLANKLSKPQSFVSKIESGERRIDLIELEQICHILDFDLIDFIILYRK